MSKFSFRDFRDSVEEAAVVSSWKFERCVKSLGGNLILVVESSVDE